LARSDPTQFGQDGLPRPKTAAARLRANLERARDSRWPDVISGSDERVREVEEELRRLVADHAAVFAREQWDRGLEAVEKIKQLAPEMLAAVAQAQHSYHVLHGIVAVLPGGVIHGTSIQVDPRLDEIERAPAGLEGLRPARVPPLVPFVCEEVDAYATQDGG
jgi:hypothetical protein